MTESVILTVSEVTNLFDPESSLTRKKSPDNKEKPIERSKTTMYILKRTAAVMACDYFLKLMNNEVYRLKYLNTHLLLNYLLVG